MAKSFMHYDVKNGIEYASVYTPRRVSGKKVNDIEYLGRVIDKVQGVYRNRARGEFTYSLENGYGAVANTSSGMAREERLILDFGDAYCLYAALQICGLYDIIFSLMPNQKDTLMSLWGYRLLGRGSNRHAEDWWEGSYASILYPNAKLRSQRISEFFQQFGEESVLRDFFKDYLGKFCGKEHVGILVDSTGLPNDIHFPLTAVNTHNGVTSNETRLLMVVDRKSQMPLFFRYNAGNIVDVTTLRSTIAELKAYGVNTDFAIVDAGYYSENNMRSLYGEDSLDDAIPFLTRLGSNLNLHKQLVADNADDLLKSKYMLMQRDRLLSVKRVEVRLWGHVGYAYVAIDHARREDEILKYAKAALGTPDVSHDEMDDAIRSKGFFVLISSEKIEPEEIMPLYYTRQVVEQVFDIGKNNADLLPLRVHSEETFRGHLLLSFITTVVYLSVNQLLKGTAFNADGAFFILRNQKCKVFDDCILPKEITKKMNDIYKKLKIKSPLSIPLCGKN
jgi:hypothetical protein